MDPGKAVPVTSAARIQRWCLFLGAFSYQIEFRGSKQHANFDGLSRLPLPQAPAENQDEVEMFHTSAVEALPVTDQELRMQTSRDPVLPRFLEFVQLGWEGADVHPELISYAHRWTEMTIHHKNSYVGKQSCGSDQAKRKSSGNSLGGTHRFGQDERLVPGVRLVAKHR